MTENFVRDPAGSGRFHSPGATAPDPSVLLSPNGRFVAPDNVGMRKAVRYKGDLMTWGDVLEKVNASGVVRTISANESRAHWSSVSDGDLDVSVRLPFTVMKASGLPDTTTDLQRITVDVEVAEIALFEMGHFPPFTRDSERRQGLVEDIRVLNLKRRDIIRDLARPQLDGMTVMDRIRFLDALPDDTDAAILEVLAEDRNIYVVRSVAGSRLRNRVDAVHRYALLHHADATVRCNFIAGNRLLPTADLRAAEEDVDSYVRDAAKAELQVRELRKGGAVS